MSKKRIMLCLYGISLVLLLVWATLSFAMYSKDIIEEDKEFLTAKWPLANDGDEVIDALYAASEEATAELALMLPTGDGQFDYYRTETDPAFFRLDGWEPGRSYATNPQAGEEQLLGFFFLFQDHFKIAPLHSLKGSDAELFRTQILVNSSDLPGLRATLAQQGAELEADPGSFEFHDPTNLISTLWLSLQFFFLITAVVYAFSRAKDMIVKKTMGYGDWTIVGTELREVGSSMLLIAGSLLLLAGLLFAALAGISSTLYFFRRSIGILGLSAVLPLLIVVLCVRVISGQCGVSHSKGKGLDRQLYAVTVVFKTLAILALAGNLTNLGADFGSVYRQHREIEAASALSEGYAQLDLKGSYVQSIINSPKEYAPRLLEFYTRMHEEHNLITANVADLFYGIEVEPLEEYQITVNDNYLDSFDTIYDADGVPIHSDRLKQDLWNCLIPLDYEFERMHPGWETERYHFIRYDASKSKFFSFSNELEGGYAYSREIPIFVSIDADPYSLGEDAMDILQWLLSNLNGCYFSYDLDSALSPRAQILPLLQESGLEEIVLAVTPVRDYFLSRQKYLQDLLIETGIRGLLFLFALVVLVLFVGELYYKIHAKDIAAKALEGYSFLDLFSLIMVFKLALLPIMLLLPGGIMLDFGFLPWSYLSEIYLPKINIWAAIACLGLDLGLFFLCMKKNMQHKIAAVMKGE
ncbi:MAG: hypothetical protein IIY94_01455 [Oscillospiraceae bacterium]|nr:hypothetical protein [Oscillospiraceae bacterium]